LGSGGSTASAAGLREARPNLPSNSEGPNPIVTVGREGPAHGAAAAGLYVTDTLSKNVYFAPASELERYRGAVVVGSELQARFWILRPRNGGFALVPVPTTLRGKHYNLEGAVYLSP